MQQKYFNNHLIFFITKVMFKLHHNDYTKQ